MSEELKPCPFCGEATKIQHYASGYHAEYVRCENVRCCGRTIFADVEEWNRRVSVEAEQLKIAVEAINKVLADEESGAGGWGPDVTMCGVLKTALAAISALNQKKEGR